MIPERNFKVLMNSSDSSDEDNLDAGGGINLLPPSFIQSAALKALQPPHPPSQELTPISSPIPGSPIEGAIFFSPEEATLKNLQKSTVEPAQPTAKKENDDDKCKEEAAELLAQNGKFRRKRKHRGKRYSLVSNSVYASEIEEEPLDDFEMDFANSPIIARPIDKKIARDTVIVADSTKSTTPPSAYSLQENHGIRIWKANPTEPADSSLAAVSTLDSQLKEVEPIDFEFQVPATPTQSNQSLLIQILSLILFFACICGTVSMALTSKSNRPLYLEAFFLLILFIATEALYLGFYSLFFCFTNILFPFIHVSFVLIHVTIIIWSSAESLWLIVFMVLALLAIGMFWIYMRTPKLPFSRKMLHTMLHMYPRQSCNPVLFILSLVHLLWVFICLKASDSVLSDIDELRILSSVFIIFSFFWASQVFYHVSFIASSLHLLGAYGLEVGGINYVRGAKALCGNPLFTEGVLRCFASRPGSFTVASLVIGLCSLARSAVLGLVVNSIPLLSFFSPQSLLRMLTFSLPYFRAARAQVDSEKVQNHQALYRGELITLNIGLFTFSSMLLILFIGNFILKYDTFELVFVGIYTLYHLQVAFAMLYSMPISLIFSFELSPNLLLMKYPFLNNEFNSIVADGQ